MENSLKDMFSKFTREETDNIDRHTSFQKTDIVAKILTKKTPCPGASLVNSTKHLRGKNITNLQNCSKTLKRIFYSFYEAIQKLVIKDRQKEREMEEITN